MSPVISILLAFGTLILGLLAGFSAGRRTSSGLAGQLATEKSKSDLLESQLQSLHAENEDKTRLDQSLKEVRQTIATLTAQAQDAEVKRASAEAAIKSTIETMKNGNEHLLRETTKLAGALSNSQSRGKYGEAQLEMILESSGLLEGIHFFKQDTRTSAVANSARPDIRIAIPGGSEIFIDSKFPFDRFLEAVGESDPAVRRSLMESHAKDLLGHVNDLAKKGYQNEGNSPDYVVLFAPFESILSEALEVDPQLLHKAFEKGITIATPTTMMALLRTVAYVFSQSDMARNASKITELAGDLLKRISRVHTKIATLGKSIKSSERAFNDLVQSAEENMLRPARKMVALGVPTPAKIGSLDEVEDDVRAIKSKQLELSEFDGEEIDEIEDGLEDNE
ncbi:MAG: DNA recombination protein RmuC [Actinomycetes bacterium]